jgi:hypothetical protein
LSITLTHVYAALKLRSIHLCLAGFNQKNKSRPFSLKELFTRLVVYSFMCLGE